MTDETPSLYARLGGREGLAKLLKFFYADVRQDNVIGPIFNERIHDWVVHLEKIGDFWALQTGGPSAYSGGFGRAHLPLGLEPKHFEHWLGLWEWNCRRHLGEVEANELIAMAQVFGRRLQGLTSGRGGLTIGN
jgi:hemoglobin